MKKKADIVIIGGGIQGTSLLYHLVERGITNVQLVEMDMLGAGATGRSAGWVLHQQSSPINTQLTLLSMKEYSSFEEKFGVDIGFINPGCIQMGSYDMISEMASRAEYQKSLGIAIDILDTQTMQKEIPFVNYSDIGIGLFGKDDCKVNPHAVVSAYVNYSKKHGAIVDLKTTATNIITKGDKVVGVETTSGTISTPLVVNAAGFRANEVGKWLGLEIPIHKSVNHEVITEPTNILNRPYPLLEILVGEYFYVSYAGPKLNQASIGIGDWETTSNDQIADLPRVVKEFGAAFEHRLPQFSDLKIVSHYAGIRPMSPDGLPILGSVDGLEGYINDCCWGGDGVAHGPAGGIIMSELITGSRLSVDMNSFLFSRFAR